MGISVLVLGQSGRGKSSSIENLNPEETLVIKSISKPFPFKSSEWKKFDKDTKTGSYIVTDNYDIIKQALLKAESLGKKVVVIDDMQYLMANDFMRKSNEKGFDKFTTIAKDLWELISIANEKIPEDIRVYMLSHTEETTNGETKIKTIGKLLDEKITVEGMVTICLGAEKEDSNYFFTTQNNGSNTCKSPRGMFDDYRIENNLRFVDDKICEFYGLAKQK